MGLDWLQVQDFDQEFTLMNKALQLSCEKGLPVRVVRSHKVNTTALLRSRAPGIRFAAGHYHMPDLLD